jgi:low temperature requirement protein LtrA
MAAAAGMLIASLAVPHAFGSDALLFGVAILVVRTIHLGAFALIARSRGDTDLARVVGRLAQVALPASILLVIAGTQDGVTPGALWGAALLVDYGGLAVRGVRGWTVQAGHFAERHGLIIIIALGESIVAIGVGADEALTFGISAAAVIGVALAATLWWAYFDVVALVAARRLTNATPGREQNEIARDSFSYLHFPMVAGIVLLALGIKKTLGHVDEPLDVEVATAMLGGLALYLLAHVAFRWRNVHRFSSQRALVAALMLALIPLATGIASIATLAIATALMVAMIAYESWRFAELRDRLRHQAAPAS